MLALSLDIYEANVLFTTFKKKNTTIKKGGSIFRMRNLNAKLLRLGVDIVKLLFRSAAFCVGEYGMHTLLASC